ncbi:MAG: peptidase T [Solirubrobacterales bacterium]|nr:peptidase T [Solirubrobacterales bacterium]
MPAEYTSALAAGLAEDLLARFSRYVRIDTQSAIDKTTTPSTSKQFDLARVLEAELRELGLEEVHVDEHAYVTAKLEANVDGAPTIGLISHIDTALDASGAGVEPIVHRNYDGGVIALPKDGTELDPASVPHLGKKRGHDIVTASGDTLLGADDKAGVAEIMAALRVLVSEPERPRANIAVAFVPDEEIGHGASLLEIPGFGARCAYTIDGSTVGELSFESFTAVEVRLRVEGVDVHPGSASGVMVHAGRLLARVIAQLPYDRLTPATTSGREGFIHPLEFSATVAKAEARVIVRDFDEDKLAGHVQLLEQTAHSVVDAEPKAKLEIEVIRQYHNMREAIVQDQDVVAAAEEAYEAEGIAPVHEPIRGGTDGSQLSLRGLPTPNLFTGGHEYHSIREWASLQDMAAASAVIVHLAEVWSKR